MQRKLFILEKLKDLHKKGVEANIELLGRQSLLHDLTDGGLGKIIGDKSDPINHANTVWLPSLEDLVLMWGKRTIPEFTGTAEQLERIQKTPWFDNVATMYDEYANVLKGSASTEALLAGKMFYLQGYAPPL